MLAPHRRSSAANSIQLVLAAPTSDFHAITVFLSARESPDVERTAIWTSYNSNKDAKDLLLSRVLVSKSTETFLPVPRRVRVVTFLTFSQYRHQFSAPLCQIVSHGQNPRATIINLGSRLQGRRAPCLLRASTQAVRIQQAIMLELSTSSYSMPDIFQQSQQRCPLQQVALHLAWRPLHLPSLATLPLSRVHSRRPLRR